MQEVAQDVPYMEVQSPSKREASPCSREGTRQAFQVVTVFTSMLRETKDYDAQIVE